MRLKEKVIIDTGSATGIGKAIAKRCMAEGARVAIHDRDRAGAEAVVAELGGPGKAVQQTGERWGDPKFPRSTDLAQAGRTPTT